MPLFDGTGTVTGYERHAVPERAEALQRDTHLGKMIGAWAGRQAEEELAQAFNRTLIDRAKAVWDRDRVKGKAKAYVDLSDPGLKDEVLKDAWSIIPVETKDYIRDIFGDDGFMVRKDMINNMVGYRTASIGDAWMGPSRFSPEMRKAVADVATLIGGKNTFKVLVTAEKSWKAGISTAKRIIVILSIVVPVANLASNVLQAATIGVPVRKIAKGNAFKLIDIDHHLKNLDRLVEIKALPPLTLWLIAGITQPVGLRQR